MPPKRKAAATITIDSPPSPERRQTRASASSGTSTSSGSKAKAKAAPAPAPAKKPPTKPKGKKKKELEEITIESSDVEVKAPAKKKVAATTTKKEPAEKKSRKRPAADSSEEEDLPPAPKKATVNPTKKAKSAPAPVASASGSSSSSTNNNKSKSQLPTTSTSTTPIPEPPDAVVKKVAKKPAPPKKPLSWEEGMREWFENFEGEDEDDKGKMGGEGIEKLFEEMDVSMEGPYPFLLAWKLNAQPGTFGSYYLTDFLTTFRERKINTTSGIKTYLASVEKAVLPMPSTTAARAASESDFKAFYNWLFKYVKEEGQKSMSGEVATAIWDIVLAPRYPVGKDFVEYTKSLGSNFKGVSFDVWSQLLEFVTTVGDDLNGYNEDDAWPSVLDSFVEWGNEQKKSS